MIAMLLFATLSSTQPLCPPHALCVQMMVGVYKTGILGSLIQLCALLQLNFCDPNIINHFFCDLPQLLVLSCSETFFLQVMKFVIEVIFGVTSVLIIMLSYSYIIAEDKLSGRHVQCLQHLHFSPDSSDSFLQIRTLCLYVPQC